jgi:hypothetical protein
MKNLLLNWDFSADLLKAIDRLGFEQASRCETRQLPCY